MFPDGEVDIRTYAATVEDMRETGSSLFAPGAVTDSQHTHPALIDCGLK